MRMNKVDMNEILSRQGEGVNGVKGERVQGVVN